MSIKKTSSSYLLVPDKRWLHQLSLLLVLVCSITLLIMSKTGNPLINSIRTSVTDIATPILSVAARPMDAVHRSGIWVSEIINMRAENIRLINENAELLKWQSQVKLLQGENDSFRSLLNVVPSQKKHFITARIVSDLGGPYVHSALINGGSNNSIKKDQAAISANGLMGRVVDVGASSARVLLLNDINSRVPVISERTREKGILAGTNADMPSLSYIAADSKIQVGDRIVTSGDGGIFPAGIPVGTVYVTENHTYKIQPFIDPANVEFVSIIDYSF
jgi:rod shape-determining protein MreC